MTQPCRLEYRGFHQLELVRHGGAEIRIGGRRRALQEPPPNVASRPPVDTVQYVYATWDERRERVKLIASTTGHETLDSEEVMRGDPAALLVGMGRPFENRPRHYHWADRPEHRTLILSRHNRKRVEWRQSLRADASGSWGRVERSIARYERLFSRMGRGGGASRNRGPCAERCRLAAASGRGAGRRATRISRGGDYAERGGAGIQIRHREALRAR